MILDTEVVLTSEPSKPKTKMRGVVHHSHLLPTNQEKAMKYKTIKQKVRIYQWKGFSSGIELPEITLGYVVIERVFKVFSDGKMRLDFAYPERLLTVNEVPINCLWHEAVLEEFFPGFTGYELEEKEVHSNG